MSIHRQEIVCSEGVGAGFSHSCHWKNRYGKKTEKATLKHVTAMAFKYLRDDSLLKTDKILIKTPAMC